MRGKEENEEGVSLGTSINASTVQPKKLDVDSVSIFAPDSKFRTMTDSMTDTATPRVALVEREEDVAQAFDCAAAAFGRQTKDGIWMAMNPGWDTSEGRTKAVERLTERWRTATRDKNGNLNTMYLKAALPDADLGGERVVGLAIWKQASQVEGYGEAPPDDARKLMDAEAIYPDDQEERRYMFQLSRSLNRQRDDVVREKAGTDPPAVMVLDLCVVDPAFQGRGIAKQLVRWGLQEAKRRGDLELIMEASTMGRRVYGKLGFEQDGGEIQYEVDAKFADREKPSNIFMRTRPIRK